MSPMLEHSQMVTQQDRMDQLRAAFHANCVACGKWGGETSRLHFTVAAPNTVHASFQPSAAYESYGGVLHGGVIATLLDAAMTNCLFALGVRGLTGELTLRFRSPVCAEKECHLRAWLERALPPLFILRGELIQDGIVKACATGKFMKQPMSEPAPLSACQDDTVAW